MEQRSQWSRPQCAQDWEDRKAVIMGLYESKTLKETMNIMEAEHSFKATEKQYKKQLQKWDIDHKRIKSTEYKAMIRKKRQREEDDQKESKFQLRGVEIDDAKIVRFQKRHRISESEQVSDCPTPPGLTCTTPAPISPSPGLRFFPWYDMYEQYLDLSMAGSSTIQTNDVQSILRSLVIPISNYEDECRSLCDSAIKKPYQIVRMCLREWNSVSFFRALSLVDLGLGRAMRVPNRHDRAIEIYHPQKLFGSIIRKTLASMKNHSYILSSLDVMEQVLVLWMVGTAGTIHRLSGRRGEAISLLETVIQMVEQDLDLEVAIIRSFHNEMVIELAQYYNEEGHRDEARDPLIYKLGLGARFRIAGKYMRCNRVFRVICNIFLIRRLRESSEKALKLIKGLENGRTNTQEHHTRNQEGSCHPGTREWGPFLTDCMEWDKL